MHQVREATNCAYVQYTAMTGAGRKVRGARDNDHILYIRVGVRQHSHQSMSVRREVRASPDMHLTSLSWSKRAAHDSSTRHTPLFTPRTCGQMLAMENVCLYISSVSVKSAAGTMCPLS
mmetsp:Transcript_30039/g.55786  ORF Transcript_30039/g.55786 Transcript_30039/m.55786 type:complete len:119 (+) Transcript_30039:1115-1471(+)